VVARQENVVLPIQADGMPDALGFRSLRLRRGVHELASWVVGRQDEVVLRKQAEGLQEVSTPVRCSLMGLIRACI
jgi:hypothetical protein